MFPAGDLNLGQFHIGRELLRRPSNALRKLLRQGRIALLRLRDPGQFPQGHPARIRRRSHFVHPPAGHPGFAIPPRLEQEPDLVLHVARLIRRQSCSGAKFAQRPPGVAVILQQLRQFDMGLRIIRRQRDDRLGGLDGLIALADPLV